MTFLDLSILPAEIKDCIAVPVVYVETAPF